MIEGMIRAFDGFANSHPIIGVLVLILYVLALLGGLNNIG